jgi:hypothetical protein
VRAYLDHLALKGSAIDLLVADIQETKRDHSYCQKEDWTTRREEGEEKKKKKEKTSANTTNHHPTDRIRTSAEHP